METFPFAPVALSPCLTICRVQWWLWWWCVLAVCGGGSPTKVYFAIGVGLDVNWTIFTQRPQLNGPHKRLKALKINKL